MQVLCIILEEKYITYSLNYAKHFIGVLYEMEKDNFYL